MVDAFMKARAQAAEQVVSVEREAGIDPSLRGLISRGLSRMRQRPRLALGFWGVIIKKPALSILRGGVDDEDRLVPSGYGELVGAYGQGPARFL